MGAYYPDSMVRVRDHSTCAGNSYGQRKYPRYPGSRSRQSYYSGSPTTAQTPNGYAYSTCSDTGRQQWHTSSQTMTFAVLQDGEMPYMWSELNYTHPSLNIFEQAQTHASLQVVRARDSEPAHSYLGECWLLPNVVPPSRNSIPSKQAAQSLGRACSQYYSAGHQINLNTIKKGEFWHVDEQGKKQWLIECGQPD